MSSNAHSEHMLDLERDLPVSRDDVEALRRLRDDVPSWFALDASELDVILGAHALDPRPLASEAWKPFSLD